MSPTGTTAIDNTIGIHSLNKRTENRTMEKTIETEGCQSQEWTETRFMETDSKVAMDIAMALNMDNMGRTPVTGNTEGTSFDSLKAESPGLVRNTKGPGKYTLGYLDSKREAPDTGKLPVVKGTIDGHPA